MSQHSVSRDCCYCHWHSVDCCCHSADCCRYHCHPVNCRVQGSYTGSRGSDLCFVFFIQTLDPRPRPKMTIELRRRSNCSLRARYTHSTTQVQHILQRVYILLTLQRGILHSTSLHRTTTRVHTAYHCLELQRMHGYVVYRVSCICIIELICPL